ncbi:MAG: hypothetical protein LWW85_00170 [Marinilabiliales bacterium]|nr:hypothetical protein [Marinilabiliales bacterium]
MFGKSKNDVAGSTGMGSELTVKADYINIPVQLLAGFLDDTRGVIRNVYYYALYSRYIQTEKGTDKDRYKMACLYYGFQETDREENLKKGKYLYDRFQHAPMTGIERSLFSEYNRGDKSEFDKACFLAYHALKSIVAGKIFQKSDNKLLWARMDGKVKTIQDVSELSDRLRFYTQEYQTLKIKRELRDNWGLVYYAQHTRGFYVSFKLDLKSLILEAMKRKKKSVEKQRLLLIRKLEAEAQAKLNKGFPVS